MNGGDIKRSDLRFADVTIDTTDNMEDIDEYFELQNFGLTVDTDEQQENGAVLENAAGK